MAFINYKQIKADEWEKAVEEFTRCEKSKAQVCADLGISRPTFKKWFTMYWENGSKTKGLPFIIQKDEDAT